MASETSTTKSVRVANREEFSKLQHFRGLPKYIAAIDFGTTHCSLTYQLHTNHASAEEMPTILRLDKTIPQSVRVPSSILFDQNGNRLSCGWGAVEEYNGMDDNQRPDFIFLEHVKMKLHFEEVSILNSYSTFDVTSMSMTLYKTQCSRPMYH